MYIITTLDIDECGENFHTCEQTCINDPGSYHCSCNTGYRLNLNGSDCDGKVIGMVWVHHGMGPCT